MTENLGNLKIEEAVLIAEAFKKQDLSELLAIVTQIKANAKGVDD